MRAEIEALKEFQSVLQQKTGVEEHLVGQNFIAGSDTASLRAKLVEEEAQELYDALQLEDTSQVLKECCDVLYVVYGVAAVYNLPLEEAFWRVHENNMLKLKSASIREDGKLMKPPGLPKVQLGDLVARLQQANSGTEGIR
jgi:NTP pyrophosphatase (non-canonical NTP hydrolase)